jgi:23S rRNA (cytidine1920-2'-O)/16S rRNA (cytidine1409-2'-O)-methyltransferase
MKNRAKIVCLIKPQFEAGRELVGKKGVVRDPSVHEDVIRMVMNHALSLGFCIRGLDHSPIRGPEGNIEYLLYMENGGEPSSLTDQQSAQAADIVALAHESL